MTTAGIDFIDVPSRMNQLWSWVVAIDSWDYCDPAPLLELIEKEPIPPEFVSAVKDIISGARNKKRRRQPN